MAWCPYRQRDSAAIGQRAPLTNASSQYSSSSCTRLAYRTVSCECCALRSHQAVALSSSRPQSHVRGVTRGSTIRSSCGTRQRARKRPFLLYSMCRPPTASRRKPSLCHGLLVNCSAASACTTRVRARPSRCHSSCLMGHRSLLSPPRHLDPEAPRQRRRCSTVSSTWVTRDAAACEVRRRLTYVATAERRTRRVANELRCSWIVRRAPPAARGEGRFSMSAHAT